MPGAVDTAGDGCHPRESDRVFDLGTPLSWRILAEPFCAGAAGSSGRCSIPRGPAAAFPSFGKS